MAGRGLLLALSATGLCACAAVSDSEIAPCPPPTAEEAALVQQFLNDPDQRRTGARCDAALTRFARERASDMARRGYFSHLTPDLAGPNTLLRQFGYPLPHHYAGGAANNVESIAGGLVNADAVWGAWLASDTHRGHVLGTLAGYQSHDRYGIGHVRAPHSPLLHYWVLVTAPAPRR